MSSSHFIAYGSLYLDQEESYDKIDKQLETFRGRNPTMIYFDIIIKKGQTTEAIAHRAQLIADCQEMFPYIPLGATYAAIGFSDSDRPARKLMLKFIEEQ
jgi:hypothetical protein